jgi:hypothetical protein
MHSELCTLTNCTVTIIVVDWWYCPRKTKGVRERYSRSMLTDSLVSKCPFPALSGRYHERRINLFSVHSTFWLVVLVNVLPDMLFRELFITSNMKIYLETPTGIWNASAHMTICSALLRAKFLSNPRRIHSGQKGKEKEGYELLWAVICCKSPPLLLPHLPPPPHCTSVAPPAAMLSGLEGWRRAPPSPPIPPPPLDYGQIFAASPKVEDGLHFGDCEYDSWIGTATVIIYEFSAQWKDT